MNDHEFWKIIDLLDWSKEDDQAVIQPAVDALAKLGIEALQSFDEILAAKLYALDTEQHAQPDDDSYFSNDLFLYNRCYVVGQGQTFYEQVLAKPEEMPIGVDYWFEVLLSLTQNAAEKLGVDDYHHITQVSYETFSNLEGWKNADSPDDSDLFNRSH